MNFLINVELEQRNFKQELVINDSFIVNYLTKKLYFD